MIYKYKILALSLLKDACNDILGRDDIDDNNVIYRDMTTEKAQRLKANALNFFFDKESEPHVKFWCALADQPLQRFRDKFKKYL